MLQRSGGINGTGQWINVYDVQALGANKGIYLTEVAGKLLVIGVTDHNISLISEIVDQEIIEEIHQSVDNHSKLTSNNASSFGHILQNISHQSQKQLPMVNTNIQNQISKLKNIANGIEPDRTRKDGSDE